MTRNTGRLLLATAIYLLPMHAAQAQDATPRGANNSSAGSNDDIIVTGVRARDATANTATAPVDVVKGDTLLRDGTSLGPALQMALPTINFPQQILGSVAAGNWNVTLRGLAPDQVLVLINGHRQHKSSFVNVKPGSSRGSEAVDLATIPVSAIDHIEVLRDAAAAQYGSDAIAGVINIVLRDSSDGGDVSVRSGFWQGGDGFTVYGRGWKGFKLPNNGSLTVAAEIGKANATDEFTSPETRKYYFPGDPREATVDKTKFYRGQPAISTDLRASANAELPLSDQLTFRSFANYARRDGYVNTSALLPNGNGTIRAFYPDGVRPQSQYYLRDLTLSAGLSFDAGAAGTFDLNATYGFNHESFTTTHTDNPSLGLASPSSFYLGKLRSDQTEVSLEWVKTFNPPIFTGPFTVSAGGAWRHEGFGIGAGEPASYVNGGAPILDGPNAGQPAPYGAQSFQAYLPGDAGSVGRNVYSGYAGVEGDIVDPLKVSLSGRAEHYSDFGSAVTGEASFRLKLAKAVALRGSISSGVRAPSLGQTRYSFLTTTYLTASLTSLSQIKTFIPTDPVAQALGATALRPEKSMNFSAGTVITLGSAGSLTIDAYSVSIRDRIVLSDNLTGPGVTAIVTAAGFPQVAAVNFFTNALNTRTQGISVAGNYRFDLGRIGSLTANLGFDTNRTDITKIRVINGKEPVGRETIGYLRYGTPNKKIIFGGTWANDNIHAQLSGIYYGGYRQLYNSQINEQTFSPQFVVNGSIGYTFRNGVGISFGADNLFGSTPDPIKTWRTDGGLPASVLNPVSWDGRFLWGQVSFKL